jgi:hypothetical protein
MRRPTARVAAKGESSDEPILRPSVWGDGAFCRRQVRYHSGYGTCGALYRDAIRSGSVQTRASVRTNLRKRVTCLEDPESRKAPQSTLPSFSVGPSQFSSLYFVNAPLQAHLLQNHSIHICGLFSPDGRHVAAIRDELTSNVWSFTR